MIANETLAAATAKAAAADTEIDRAYDICLGGNADDFCASIAAAAAYAHEGITLLAAAEDMSSLEIGGRPYTLAAAQLQDMLAALPDDDSRYHRRQILAQIPAATQQLATLICAAKAVAETVVSYVDGHYAASGSGAILCCPSKHKTARAAARCGRRRQSKQPHDMIWVFPKLANGNLALPVRGAA